MWWPSDAGYPDDVRRRALVGSMLAGAACTSLNPAYDLTGETGEESSEAETVGGGSTVAEATLGSTRGEATDAPDSDATTEDASGSSSSSSGEPPPVLDLCPFDVYAINEAGELHGLDPDAGELALVLEDPRLQSWAIATDPTTGLVYINELASPTTMWRVDPFVAEIDAEPVVVTAEVFADDVARATFRGDGELWIGTEQTHRFVWLPPSGGSIGGDHTLQPFPRGGDMVFLEEECAVVPTLDGTLYRACFPDPGLPPPIIPMEALVGAQFNGIAVDAQGRVWLSNANPTTQLVLLDVSVEPWVVMDTIDYDITINDLATVVHPPGC